MAILDTLYSAVRQLKRETVMIALPTTESGEVEMFAGHLKAVIDCDANPFVFVVQRVTSGEILAWGDSATLPEAITAALRVMGRFASPDEDIQKAA